jgi:hypothetical protein
MGLLRMLSRSAFICNICFLLAVFLLWIRQPVYPGLASLVIVMGFVLSIILNGIVNLCCLIRRISRKPFPAVPRGILYTNAGFLAIQLILLFK